MNTRKKILIVSSSFYPMNSPRSFRTTELVKEFSRMGHDVTLLTVPNISHEKIERDYNISIKYLKTSINRYGKRNLFNKIAYKLLKLFFEYPDSKIVFEIRKELKQLKGFDLLISIAAPHPTHWGVATVYNKSIAKKWIADCGDPFMGPTLDRFKRPFYFKFVEKWWCKKADFITIPFVGAKKAYYKDFHNKIKVIPQGFNFEESGYYLSEYIGNEVTSFAFAGSIIPNHRDPREFIEYLIASNKRCKFFVFTKNIDVLRPYLNKKDCEIIIRDYLPRKELLSFLRKMDFVLNVNNNISTQLPSKLIDYRLTNRPILSINSRDIDKKIIDQFFDENYKNQLVIDNFECYNIKNVCSNFLKLSS